MARFLKIIIFTQIVLTCKIVTAQIDTSVFNRNYRTFTITENNINRHENWKVLDTSIVKNEQFHPMYAKFGLFQDLGNIGSASQSLIFSSNRNFGYNFTQNPWNIFFFKPEERTYYNSKSPITDLTYVQGGVDLIYLKTKIGINITPRWSFGVDFFRLTSKGNFLSQKNGSYHTQAFTYYQSKNEKYAFIGNLTWNLGYNEESGGLVSDSSFEAITGSNKTGNVKLNKSENGYRNRSLYTKQYFYYGKSFTKIQNEDTLNKFISYGHFSHTLKLEDEIYYFRVNGDSNLTIFPNGLIKTFNDSITSQTLSNKFAYTLYNTDRVNELRYIELAATHQFLNTDIQTNTKYYNNVFFEGKIERISFKNFGISLKGYAAYSPIGYTQNDLKISGDIGYKTPWFLINGGVLNNLYSPDFTFTNFNSTQFNWDNNSFNKINVSNVNGVIETRLFKNNFKLSFNQNLLVNWVYFGTDAKPVQSDKVALVQTFELEKTFKLWKFNFENKILFQKSSADFIRIPEFGAVLRYYFQQLIFNKALNLQLGFNVFYNTAFYAQAYNPATRGFYLQNNKQIGNYPLINVFVCGELRHAIIFASYEHLNQDWFKSSGFYNTPNHPLALTTLRIGIRWRMYN